MVRQSKSSLLWSNGRDFQRIIFGILWFLQSIWLLWLIIIIKNILQHENYNPNSLANDIALIELDDFADINQFVDVVEMAESSDGDFAFVDCFIIGWGGDECKAIFKVFLLSRFQ